MNPENPSPEHDNPSPFLQEQRRKQLRRFNAFFAFFKMGWVITCCLLMVASVVGLVLFSQGRTTDWLIILAGSLCALFVGRCFLKYVQARLEHLSSSAPAPRSESQQSLPLLGKIVLGVMGLILCTGGVTVLIKQQVYTDNGWKKVPGYNAWILGILTVIFGTFCLLALFGNSEPSTDTDRHTQDTDSSPSAAQDDR